MSLTSTAIAPPAESLVDMPPVETAVPTYPPTELD